MQQIMSTCCGFVCLLATVTTLGAGQRVPQTINRFLGKHCVDCHNRESGETDVDLSDLAVNWSRKDQRELWERVIRVVAEGDMPPAGQERPQQAEIAHLVDWIDKSLRRHTPIGGTHARRLNRVEYEATIQSLIGLKSFRLPEGFPADRSLHGFDNLGEGLLLSPPLLQSYVESARTVADRVFPPEQKPVRPQTQVAAPQDLVVSYSSAKLVEGALRLGMKCDPIHRSCTWPSRIETKVSGTYHVALDLSRFRPASSHQKMVVKVLARDVASADGVSHRTLRLLKELEVTSDAPQSFTFPAKLYEGQTLVVHWANATLDSDRADKASLQEFFRQKDKQNPKYLAAWHAMLNGSSGQGFRGGLGWKRVKSQLARPDLPQLDETQKQKLLQKISGNPVLYAETVVFDVFENGPALEVHRLELKGPFERIEGPLDRESQRLRMAFFAGTHAPEQTIKRFLSRAFRRPVDQATLKNWVAIYHDHLDAGHSHDEAMHLVIRNALISPRFLYRSLTDGPLDDFDLATRLSYFLTSGPPDTKLTAQAAAGRLVQRETLRAEAERLLPRSAADPLVVQFTEQWLGTRRIADIMPDRRFRFTTADAENAKLEAEHFFFEMLDKNRVMTDFIDPDFTWTSTRIAKNIYSLKSGFHPKKANVVHRVDLPRGGRYGGVLGQSAVMLATANGVDTQPVMRGVWVLENILGMPPPPPPKAVPPLTPDTTQAKTPRELLAAHTAAESCHRCHRKIDPVGLALENYDPVGKWRTKWPKSGQPIDASTILMDNTPIRDAVEFKAWLVQNVDLFSQCLAEKLMTYGTGRHLNYAERKEVATIVEKHASSGGGFRDLLLDLIESKTFRTK